MIYHLQIMNLKTCDCELESYISNRNMVNAIVFTELKSTQSTNINGARPSCLIGQQHTAKKLKPGL
jgi:hypothetical protein